MEPLVTVWPDLSYALWRDTAATLQLWTQIVGKVRLRLTPWLNHGWQVPLYVSAHGLGTSPIPIGDEILEIEFDFIRHRLVVRTSLGEKRTFPLEPQSVAEFYRRVIDLLRGIGVAITINEMPNEVPNPIRFSNDRTHASYDAEAAHSFWRALVQVDRVLKLFRSSFLGKGESRPFFLGRFRLCGHPFLWTEGSAPSRQGPRVARRSHARSLFARSQQRRVLAGQRRLPTGCFLLLRLSRTGGLPRPTGYGRRPLRGDAGGVHPALRCSP